MRLIDADALELKITKEKDAVVSHDTYGIGYNNGMSMAHAMSVMSPTIDAVEVVRCKDCIHDNTTDCPLCWIENHTLQFINHDAEFFCGKGERRKENV